MPEHQNNDDSDRELSQSSSANVQDEYLYEDEELYERGSAVNDSPIDIRDSARMRATSEDAPQDYTREDAPSPPSARDGSQPAITQEGDVSPLDLGSEGQRNSVTRTPSTASSEGQQVPTPTNAEAERADDETMGEQNADQGEVDTGDGNLGAENEVNSQERGEKRKRGENDESRRSG